MSQGSYQFSALAIKVQRKTLGVDYQTDYYLSLGRTMVSGKTEITDSGSSRTFKIQRGHVVENQIRLSASPSLARPIKAAWKVSLSPDLIPVFKCR